MLLPDPVRSSPCVAAGLGRWVWTLKMKKSVTRRGKTGKTTRRRRKKADISGKLLVILPIIILAAAVLLVVSLLPKGQKEAQADNTEAAVSTLSGDIDWFGAPDIDVQLLTVNEYSRPGIALQQVKGIVIHYTANPGSSAQANRDYFENLKNGGDRKVSSHFVIGLEGEIIQCIPTSEIAYASNSRNTDTISIECCHPDDTGEFTEATYDSLVQLTGWLCKRFSLDKEDVIRHYDVTGKDCPRYFVQNEADWEQLQEDIETKKEEIRQQEK